MDYKGYNELGCYIQARLLRKFISDLDKKLPHRSIPYLDKLNKAKNNSK